MIKHVLEDRVGRRDRLGVQHIVGSGLDEQLLELAVILLQCCGRIKERYARHLDEVLLLDDHRRCGLGNGFEIPPRRVLGDAGFAGRRGNRTEAVEGVQEPFSLLRIDG